MNLREISLPSGWYPRNHEGIARFLSGFSSEKGKASAALSPHAGWYYSGRIAAAGVSSLKSGAQTVVVVGGHLPAGFPALFALEDAVDTPLGAVPIDVELRDKLIAELDGRDDRYQDNTVEVLLPMVKYFFPDASLVWIRLPADIASFEAGKTIAACAGKLKRDIRVLASADLTHYGDNYGYSPRGKGEKALAFVREENDARFIQAVLEGSPETVLQRADQDRSCCSAGSVLGAMGFAHSLRLAPPLLVEYGTSADNEGYVPDSFVGYAAMSFFS
jgi:AmmeMemoRadiSam system protein B